MVSARRPVSLMLSVVLPVEPIRTPPKSTGEEENPIAAGVTAVPLRPTLTGLAGRSASRILTWALFGPVAFGVKAAPKEQAEPELTVAPEQESPDSVNWVGSLPVRPT